MRHGPWAAISAIVLSAALVFAAPARAGQGDEVLAGAVIGTSAGLVVAGAINITYENEDADRNFATILIAGGLAGATVGTLFGLALPDDALERELGIEPKPAAPDKPAADDAPADDSPTDGSGLYRPARRETRDIRWRFGFGPTPEGRGGFVILVADFGGHR
ncbi:hypothetical protein K8I61_17895 [bacterium]|nr:hypothetical protein [bacterium]